MQHHVKRRDDLKALSPESLTRTFLGLLHFSFAYLVAEHSGDVLPTRLNTVFGGAELIETVRPQGPSAIFQITRSHSGHWQPAQ